ncbi:MAG: zinc ABC transporter solute-binding protein, partial [Gammaproteobacteria bacterium]|nr:zinc ABC transporter solute-binding protein [Gammaproteobacteria bacterium]
LIGTALAENIPRIVVSVLPIHSLVAGVMDGVGKPDLIIKGYGSPHSYQLRPSDALNLSNADLVFWVGEPLETFLVKPISNLTEQSRVVKLIDTKGLILLSNRTEGSWDKHYHSNAQISSGPNTSTYTEVDPHFWLDPRHAVLIVTEVVTRLSSIDPIHTSIYRKNGESLRKRIEVLDANLHDILVPVQKKPYVVLHDAYQYFEKRYALNAVGSATLNPDRMPGTRRLIKLRNKIHSLGSGCIFSEPQFKSSVVKVLLDGSGMHHGILDPLGIGIKPGKDAYFRMMKANASAVSECLQKGEKR